MRILAGSKMFLEFIEDEKEFFINNNLGSTKEEFLLIENIDETTWNLLKNEYGAYLIQKQTELEFIEKDYTSSYSTTFKNTIAALGITSAFFGLLISVLPPEQNRSYYYSKPDKINCYY